MPGTFDVQILGVEQITRRLKPDLIGEPLRDFFKTAAQVAKERISNLTPGDTRTLVNSYKSEVESAPVPTYGRVWTDAAYAPFVEFDTRPHMPPVDALRGWAGRKGLNPWAVAMAIKRRGTRGRHMFELGLERSKGAIQGLMRDLAQAIERRWVA